MMQHVLLLACESPRWTPEGVMAPHRAQLDTDRDGRLSYDEFAVDEFPMPMLPPPPLPMPTPLAGR